MWIPRDPDIFFHSHKLKIKCKLNLTSIFTKEKFIISYRNSNQGYEMGNWNKWKIHIYVYFIIMKNSVHFELEFSRLHLDSWGECLLSSRLNCTDVSSQTWNVYVIFYFSFIFVVHSNFWVTCWKFSLMSIEFLLTRNRYPAWSALKW